MYNNRNKNTIYCISHFAYLTYNVYPLDILSYNAYDIFNLLYIMTIWDKKRLEVLV